MRFELISFKVEYSTVPYGSNWCTLEGPKSRNMVAVTNSVKQSCARTVDKVRDGASPIVTNAVGA